MANKESNENKNDMNLLKCESNGNSDGLGNSANQRVNFYNLI